jgi:hypothetical protein
MLDFEPKSRNEALLNAIANGQESTIVPQSRNEFLLSEISKKHVPEFTPHTRNEVLLMEVARTVAEGGGGNPNRVETITGTLAVPFGDMKTGFEIIAAAIVSGDVHAKIEFDFNGKHAILPFYAYAIGSSYVFHIDTCRVNADASYSAISVVYYGDGTLESARQIGTDTQGQVVDLSPYAPYVVSELTIYWHPLPEA